MLDIHTHILPGMDDGSRSIRQSLAMLREQKKQGVDKVVLTPHFYAGAESPEHFLKRREQAMMSLDQAIQNHAELPQRIAGAEVAYFSGMSRVDALEQLCIGQTQAMLIEMPFCRWSRNMLDEIVFLKKSRGIRPVLAHVERYMKYQPRETIAQLCGTGIMMQVNASFFLRWRTSLTACRMLKKRGIHFVGSDCHNMDSRSPNLGLAAEKIDGRLGETTIRYLEEMERVLLEG